MNESLPAFKPEGITHMNVKSASDFEKKDADIEK